MTAEPQRRFKLAEMIWRKALKGDTWASNTLIERIDGKSPRPVEVTTQSTVNNVFVNMTTEQLAQYIQLFKAAGILKDDDSKVIESNASPSLPEAEEQGEESNDNKDIEEQELRSQERLEPDPPTPCCGPPEG
jgi:hypothetical protein